MNCSDKTNQETNKENEKTKEQELKKIEKILLKMPVIGDIKFIGIHPKHVLYEICNSFNITYDRLINKSQKREIVLIRQIAAYFLIKYPKKIKKSQPRRRNRRRSCERKHVSQD